LTAAPVPSEELLFREGRPRDLQATHRVQQLAFHEVAGQLASDPAGPPPSAEAIDQDWQRSRPLLEFLAAQEGCYWICEDEGELVGYGRSIRFDGMEQLTELFVLPAHHGRGIGRGLLQRCWPEPPTPELGRIVVAAGSNVDMTLYTAFGAMPVTGHWHLRQPTERYLAQRAHETDTADPGVHVLAVERAVAEWKRLEPPAIGHDRPALHEHFGRERACLATLEGEEVTAVCWVSTDGGIGPAVGRSAQDLVPVLLAALDRVAKTKEPEHLDAFVTTESWWLLRRLRELGFRLYWPSWVMSSVPLPGLDRYVPTSPAWVL